MAAVEWQNEIYYFTSVEFSKDWSRMVSVLFLREGGKLEQHNPKANKRNVLRRDTFIGASRIETLSTGTIAQPPTDTIAIDTGEGGVKLISIMQRKRAARLPGHGTHSSLGWKYFHWMFLFGLKAHFHFHVACRLDSIQCKLLPQSRWQFGPDGWEGVGKDGCGKKIRRQLFYCTK